MSKQSSFLDLAYHKPCKNRTRDFLQIMDRVIPWDDLVAIVDPYVSLNKTGRKHIPIETKIRCLCLQAWYNLSDPGLEDAINDRLSFQEFLRLDLLEDVSLDESTICKFRHLLERHQLYQAIFEKIVAMLYRHNYIMKSGTIVDATIVSAPGSVKTRQKVEIRR